MSKKEKNKLSKKEKNKPSEIEESKVKAVEAQTLNKEIEEGGVADESKEESAAPKE